MKKTQKKILKIFLNYQKTQRKKSNQRLIQSK